MNPLGKGVPDRLRNDGSPVEVPVIVVNGATGGPVVCLIGANHGDEYNGPAVIGRLYHQPINATVRAGTLMFRVIDPFGAVREEQTAPFDCVVLDVRLRATATPGEWVHHCGRL